MLRRALAALGSRLLLGICRVFVSRDKRRPRFRGAIRKPVWTAEGIAADSIAAGGGVVLVVGALRGDSSKRLVALDAATGRQLWASSIAPERVVAVGNQTAFVLAAAESASRLRWIELATGRELDYSADWTPHVFVADAFYGFDDKNYAVAVNEQGGVLQQAHTAFESPIKLAVGAADAGDIVAALGHIGGRRQRMVVFNRVTLRSLWSTVFTLPQDWVGRTDLVVAGDAVFVREYEIHMEGDTSTTHAFDARTGIERWQRTDRGEVRGEDGLLGFDGGVLLCKQPYKGYTIASGITGMDRSNLGFEPSPFFVTGIDPATGKDVWTASLYTRGDEGIVAGGGRLYTRDKKHYALINEAGHATPASWLTCVDPATSAEIWRTQVQPETYFTAPVVLGDLVFVGGSPYNSTRGRAVVLAFSRD